MITGSSSVSIKANDSLSREPKIGVKQTGKNNVLSEGSGYNKLAFAPRISIPSTPGQQNRALS
jgi:hypothetical protein